MESALLMNSGAEGVETAIKLARKWGYEKKGGVWISYVPIKLGETGKLATSVRLRERSL